MNGLLMFIGAIALGTALFTGLYYLITHVKVVDGNNTSDNSVDKETKDK